MTIPHREIISVDAPLSRSLYDEPKYGKDPGFRITDNKELQRQGSTDDCRVLVLKFIHHIIQENPISEIIQIIRKLIEKVYARHSWSSVRATY